MKKTFDRRSFIKSTALVGASTMLGCQKKEAFPHRQNPEPQTSQTASETSNPKPTPKNSSRSRVVLIRSNSVLDQAENLNEQELVRMLDEGLKNLLEESEAQKAWARLLKKEDVLGIKSNVWKFMPTPKVLEDAIIERALAQGLTLENIGVDDRGVLKNPVFQRATALINLRTLRTHHWSGIGSCLKNYIMFHPEPWSWHEDSCADLGGLWKLPLVEGKTRLNIQVALTPLFHGKGPHHFQAEYTWPFGGLILSQDPVAVDAVAIRLLQAKRSLHFGKEQPFAVEPKHVRMAEEKYRLGVADLSRIDLIRLGPKNGMLI